MSLKNKYLKSHCNSENFIFDYSCIRIDTQYKSGDWYIDTVLTNNINGESLITSIEGGPDLENAIRMTITDLIEKLAWEEDEYNAKS
jgi:hypothetical protein